MEIDIDGYIVLIDKEDYARITALKWSRHKCKREYEAGLYYFYHSGPRNNGNPRMVKLHRFIMNLEYGNKQHVDHINGNTLDNRKCNLRLCTQAQNAKNVRRRKTNKSGYKGVSWDNKNKKWRAVIQNDNVFISLGRYKDKEEARKAYAIAAIKYHGEFARLE